MVVAINKRNKKYARGSALIMTVMLTSILAIVGVMFVLSSRIDNLSTSSLIEERELNNAVDSILSILSEELILDTPGVAKQEYYDYPGDKDKWLASIEPYDANGVYSWAQISDVTGYIASRYDSNTPIATRWGKGPASSGNGQTNVQVDAEGYDDSGNDLEHYPFKRKFVPEYHPITLNEKRQLHEQWADADGDGIADSKWIELEDFSTGKGQKVYAAVRVIDNGTMLNINSAYHALGENAPESERVRVDGSRLHQIDIKSLAQNPDNVEDISLARSGFDGTDINDLEDYERGGVWRITEPNENYRLFDISDELEFRYRFCLDSAAESRIENVWGDTISPNDDSKQVPYGQSGTIKNWQDAILDPCDPNYTLSHILTTYNMDRIIDPEGEGMFNVNPDPNETKGLIDYINHDYGEDDSYDMAKKIYKKLLNIVDANNISETNRVLMKRDLAQWVVNMIDLRDRDIDPTALELEQFDEDNDFNGEEYVFGIEPFPVITQVAMWIHPNDPGLRDPNDPTSTPNFYAVELFNPFDQAIEFSDTYPYQLVITDFNENIDPNDPNTFMADPCDPNTFSNVIATFNLGGSGLSLLQDDYIVLQNGGSVFDVNTSIDPNFFESNLPNLIFSSGYKVTKIRGTGGTPDRIIVDSNIVDSHNLAIRRLIEVKDSDIEQFNYLDRQIIYKDWVRHTNEPNMLTRSFARNYDIELSKWWDVVYHDPNLADVIDPNGFLTDVLGDFSVSFTSRSLDPRPAIDIIVPYSSTKDFVTVGDIDRIWTIGPSEILFDPPDVNRPGESFIFNPNSIDVADNIDVNDFNDPNFVFESRLTRFNSFDRSIGEQLAFVSISLDRSTCSGCPNEANLPAGRARDEDLIRLNLGDPLYPNIMQYLTVFDPRVDGLDNDGDGIIDNGEFKVPGRININTAPAYVIARLPWMTADLARAFVDYRDRRNEYEDRFGALDVGSNELDWHESKNDVDSYFWNRSGISSIGELTLVVNRKQKDKSIRFYSMDPEPDLTSPYFPDLTGIDYFTPKTDDRAKNDFEERHLIFSRVSNLVTVRSDVFTAYILVRLGTDGPQKRMLAILDRSDVYDKNDKVKIIALQAVPDPR